MSTSETRGFGANRFVKTGSTSKTPTMMWIEHMKHPRRVHPRKNLDLEKLELQLLNH